MSIAPLSSTIKKEIHLEKRTEVASRDSIKNTKNGEDVTENPTFLSVENHTRSPKLKQWEFK